MSTLEAFFMEPLYDQLGSSNEMLRQVSKTLRAAVDRAQPCMQVRVSMEYYATLEGNPAQKNASLLQTLAELSARVRITALTLTNLQLDGTEPLLAEVIRAHSKHLTRVDFSNNDFSSHMPDVLGPALAECTGLTHVTMLRCTLCKDELEVLMPHLARCTRLTVLDLTDNFLMEIGGKAVAAALRSLPLLEELRLVGTVLNDECARALAAALPDLPALRVLDLHNNGIRFAGCTAVADALRRCPALQELHLRNNYIQDEGCAALVHALAERPAPGMLVDVRGNSISAPLMVSAQAQGLLCYNWARVNAAQAAPVTAWGANGVTDAALCADEPGLCKAELRAMRSLLFLPVDL